MPLEFPANATEIINRSKSDVKLALPNSDPFSLRESFISALIVAAANRQFDTYFALKQLLIQLFPDTATGQFAERWGSFVNINRLPATGSVGNLFFTGTASTVIPISTELTTSDGNTYETTSEGTIAAQVISASSIVRSGSTATVTTTSDHGLSNTVEVTVAGADQTEYNITTPITVTASNQFTYTVSGTPASPATGTITVAFTGINIPVQSTTFGKAANKVLGSSFTLSSPITGVDNTALADFNGVQGGADQESDGELIARYTFRYRNPVANFNVAAITNKAREIAGVTRVFVQQVTPVIGQVTIYFTRDNDSSIIPSAQEITAVKDNILTILPATSDPDDVFVLAPTAVTTNFTISGLTPDTSTMRTSIENNLKQLFSSTSIGVDVTENEYLCAVAGTIDTTTGDTLTSFTIDSPTGDITIADGELALLGTVTFS